MEKTYVYEQTFEGIEHNNNPLALGEYEACVFRNCDFSDANLYKFRFVDCQFIDCNWSNARVEATAFQGVLFTQCKLLGIHFEHCTTFGLALSFEQCQLNHSSFYQLELQGTCFDSCSLLGVDFTAANLSEAQFLNCDCSQATFEQTNLEQADFTSAQHYTINPTENRLKGARFSLPHVVGLLSQYNIHIERLAN